MKKDVLIILVIVVAFALVQSLNFVGIGTDNKVGPLLTQTTDDTFQEHLSASGDWVMLDFWAPWCANCLQFKPAINKVASSLKDSVNVLAVNVDDAPGIAGQFNVSAIPTVVLLYQGREIDRRTGGMPAPVLESWITSLQESSPVSAYD
ncbi:MAG: thioredoxin family protein [Kiritimatiellae bacterium]|jgi:thioredoxin 2|nr:thioredoxin family protein [Kiritimatiellia bacterium]